MASLQQIISRAIQKADKSYFFENYDKQAQAVIRQLEQEGYVILPKQPDEAMLKEAVNQIAPGKVRPEQHVERVYHALIAASRKR